MAKQFWIFLVLLAILMIIGYFLCNKYICPLVGVPAAAAATDSCSAWDVNDGNNDIFDINRNVRFARSGHIHQPTNIILSNAITTTGNYLKANANKSLTITGLYESQETNSNTLHANLGLSRADDVRAWLLSQQVPAGQININSKVVRNACFKGDTLRRGIEFALN